MEGNKPQSKPASSSHVIDLRQAAAGAAPAPQPAPAARKPAPQPARPQPPVAPVAQPVAKIAKPVPRPQAAPSRPVRAAQSNEEALVPRRRFWPAFWRFLVLLIVLGLVIIIGLYVYLNYVRV